MPVLTSEECLRVRDYCARINSPLQKVSMDMGWGGSSLTKPLYKHRKHVNCISKDVVVGRLEKRTYHIANSTITCKKLFGL